MSFEDPKSILEAAAAKPAGQLDVPALMRRGARQRRARLTAAVAGVAVAAVATWATFGLLADEGDPKAALPAGERSAGCDPGDPSPSDDLACMTEVLCKRPPALEVSIFLADDAGAEEVAGLRARLLTQPGVEDVEHMTQADAYAEFQALYPDQPELWATISESDLPASLRVQATTEAAVDRILAMSPPFVDEILSGLDFYRRHCGDGPLPTPGDNREKPLHEVGSLRITLRPCGVEVVEFAGREWVAVDPPFDATNAPRDFTGGGRMQETSEGEAVYVDASGITLHFRAAGAHETGRCR